MSSAALTSPPTTTARLVVDTDVASYVFKWHPDFAVLHSDNRLFSAWAEIRNKKR